MTYDVIVVGGGLAGLTATQYLTKQDLKLGLFEARATLGGRIQTVPSTDGWPMNAGAFILPVDSKQPNLLVSLLQSYSIRTQSLPDLPAFAYDTQGQKHSFQALQGIVAQEMDALLKRVQEAKNTQSLRYQPLSEIVNTLETLPLDSAKFWAYKLLSACIKQHTGAPLEELTALEFMLPSFIPDTFVMMEDSSKLIKELHQDADKTGNLKMFLNSPVTKIQALEDNLFKVTLKKGESHTARAIIVAVPFSILQAGKIELDPNFAEEKLKVLPHFAIRQYNKVLLEFSDVFWEKEEPYLYPNSPDLDSFPRYFNGYYFSNQKVPYLIAEFEGKEASFGNQKEEAILEFALAPLKKIYTVSKLKSHSITRFDSDPYIMGGPWYCSKQVRKKDFSLLKQNGTPGLYFAGDYLNLVTLGTLNAAFDSGLEAGLSASAYLNYKKRILPSFH